MSSDLLNRTQFMLIFFCVRAKLPFWVSHPYELLYAHPHANTLLIFKQPLGLPHVLGLPLSSKELEWMKPKFSECPAQLDRWKLVKKYVERITHNKIPQGSSVWFSSIGFSWHLSAAHTIPVHFERQKEQYLIC